MIPVPDRTYRFKDLQKITGITHKEKFEWIARGIISAEATPGSGSHRHFTWDHVMEARVAKVLVEHFGIRAGAIQEIMEALRERMKKRGETWEAVWWLRGEPHNASYEIRSLRAPGSEAHRFSVRPATSLGYSHVMHETMNDAAVLQINLTSIAQGISEAA